MFSKESFPFEDAPDSKVLSFLPLNHIFERMVSLIYISSGASIYYAESLDTIAENKFDACIGGARRDEEKALPGRPVRKSLPRASTEGGAAGSEKVEKKTTKRKPKAKSD